MSNYNQQGYGSGYNPSQSQAPGYGQMGQYPAQSLPGVGAQVMMYPNHHFHAFHHGQQVPPTTPGHPPPHSAQMQPHYPTSSPKVAESLPFPTRAAPIPSLTEQIPEKTLRTSPRSNKGHPPRDLAVPLTEQRKSGAQPAPTAGTGKKGKKPAKKGDTSGTPAPDNDEEEGEEGTSRWSDEDTTTLLAYIYGDVEDGDVGGGCYDQFKDNKAWWYTKMANELFAGRRKASSIKSKHERMLQFFNCMVEFEDHTGGGGDGDDESFLDEEKIANKLNSARKAGATVGGIKPDQIRKWRANGWYETINRRIGARLNVRNQFDLNSTRDLSPFEPHGRTTSSALLGDEEEIDVDGLEMVADDPTGAASKPDVVTAEAEALHESQPPSTNHKERREGKEGGEAPEEKKKKVKPEGGASKSSKRPGSGVEEPAHKKSKKSSASADTAETLASTAAYFNSRADIDKRNLELKEQQFKRGADFEREKLRVEVAKGVAAGGTQFSEALKAEAEDLLSKIMRGEKI
ncbi:hypothetical protein FS837_008542 [Tulasnella sp. UAMH 9824]|nr:hypothetical protein FS837_008542 [Tulasnella sp. UAMH 9824]